MTDANITTMCAGAAGRTGPLASIIVNNFNYGRYLRQAIDSALNQHYPHTEIIVVDDGSTDDSREIIASYGSRIRAVLKPNGGQASALNAGFAASQGEVVLFLDADDVLFSEAVASAVSRLSEAGVSKVHWAMWIIDAAGQRTGEMRPNQPPLEGDFRRQVLERGPSNVPSAPTSGNAWSRSFLSAVMPIPEDAGYYRLCADEFLYTLAPVFGRMVTIQQPQGCYRVHGDNVYSSRTFADKLNMEVSGHAEQCDALAGALLRNGIAVSVESWRQHSWFHRLDRAVSEIRRTIPVGSRLVLVDGETWGIGRGFEGRQVRPFFSVSNMDWGPPADDRAAIDCFSDLLSEDVSCLVLGWPCFWWLDEYRGLFQRLDSVATRVVDNRDVIIFDLGLVAARLDEAAATVET